MTEKRFNLRKALYKRREGSTNIAVYYVHDSMGDDDDLVKCCGADYVDVFIPKSAVVTGSKGKTVGFGVCDKLNELNDENEHLKSEIENNIASFKANNRKPLELEKENEQLKKELESFKPIIFESDGKPVTLYKKGDVE